jgi:hypothetical protein
MNVKAVRVLAAAVVASAAVLFGVSESGASTSPGTAAQVAADVSKSLSIKTIPANLRPSLGNAATDLATVGTPSLSRCDATGATLSPSKCVYGDRTGSKTVVLWGDSHAFMWFPAVNAIAKAAHWKLVALMEFGCPVADISVWNPFTKTPYKSCDTFRKNMIAAINKLNPSLVIVTEAFSSMAASGGGSSNTITPAQWQMALETTLKDLHSKKMKKLVIGSTVRSAELGLDVPVQCLAANTTSIQTCTISDDAAQQAQRAAESTAAKAESARYVNVLPWMCSSATKPVSCSPIAGDSSGGFRVVYYATGHLTETYALWLSTVLRAALKPSM